MNIHELVLVSRDDKKMPENKRRRRSSPSLDPRRGSCGRMRRRRHVVKNSSDGGYSIARLVEELEPSVDRESKKRVTEGVRDHCPRVAFITTDPPGVRAPPHTASRQNLFETSEEKKRHSRTRNKLRSSYQLLLSPESRLDEMAQPGGGQHHQESPLVRSETVKRTIDGDHGDSIEASPPLPHQISSAVNASSSTPTGPPQKKRITRKRAILSCRACTTRKIRCERDSPGSACRACDKRGEAALCDPGSTPGANNPSIM